jgi:dTDP-4-dehydrorhamnose reductase
VFDGRKDTPYASEIDLTNPLNMYGKSKLDGEENTKTGERALPDPANQLGIQRTGNSFVNKVLEWSRKNSLLRIVDDQVGSPTWARMLAEITILLLAQNQTNLHEKIRERSGIYHLAGSGYTSRYEWAKQILANDPHRAEQTVQALEPGSTKEFPTPATRPLFSALDCSRFEKTFGLRLPPWNSTLELAMAG